MYESVSIQWQKECSLSLWKGIIIITPCCPLPYLIFNRAHEAVPGGPGDGSGHVYGSLHMHVDPHKPVILHTAGVRVLQLKGKGGTSHDASGSHSKLQ